jgi:DHA1 family multidrug resistance protein-like MFS transporter
MNFTFYIGSSIYVPGEQSVVQDFQVSLVVATLGLSLFSLGYGLGPMLWSPMSEIPRVGRSNIYFFTLMGFVLLQLPTGYAVNMPMLLVFRFLTGFLGSPALATGGATISDVYQPASVSAAIPIWGWFGICGPVFGPIIGGFAARAEGWRMTIWILSWLGAFTIVVIFFLMPETSAAAILYQRAKRLRQATGELRLQSQSELDAASYTMRNHLIMLGRAFTLTFSEPVVFVLDLYTALLYGILFIWFESFPLVFGDIYHFDMGEQGLVFLGIFSGSLIALACFLLWIRCGIAPYITRPDFAPERMLPPTFMGAVSLPICLFWYGWSARAEVHWIVPIIGSSFFAVGIVTLFPPVLNYIGFAYPRDAASIYAGNGLFRASFGAIFPLFVSQIGVTS